MNITGTRSYEWRLVNSECSESCGEGMIEVPKLSNDSLLTVVCVSLRSYLTGVRKIRVVCVLAPTQVTVTDENCNIARKPRAKTSEVCNTQPCDPEYVAITGV